MSYFSDYFKAQALVNLQVASGGVALGETAVSLASGEGVKLETLTRTLMDTGVYTGGYLMGILWDGSVHAGPLQDPDAESIRIDSHAAASDTIAVVLRGQDDTTDGNHNTAGHTYYITVVLSPTIQTDLYSKLGYKDAIFQRPMTFVAPYNVSSWISYALCNGEAGDATSFAKDVIYATRHFLKKGTIIYGVKFRCNISSNTASRFGIWANDYSGNPYPGSQLLEVVHTGTQVTALITEAPFPYTVPHDDAFWVGVNLANMISILKLDEGKPFDNFLGRQLHSSSVQGKNMGISAAHVYGALPDPFTSGGALILGTSAAMPYLEFIYQTP